METRKRIAEKARDSRVKKREINKRCLKLFQKVIGFNVQLWPVQVHLTVPLFVSWYTLRLCMWAFLKIFFLTLLSNGRGFNETLFTAKDANKWLNFNCAANRSSREASWEQFCGFLHCRLVISINHDAKSKRWNPKREHFHGFCARLFLYLEIREN